MKEGTFKFHPGKGFNSCGGYVSRNAPHQPPGLVDPVAEYDHTAPKGSLPQGEAILGGFVYRGSGIPDLAGHYVFGDYSRGSGKPDGRLFYQCDSPDVTHRVCNLLTDPGIYLLGFGRDAVGRVHVLGNTTGVLSGHTGVVKLLTKG